ncbi:hypothetical protein RIF29_24392 [Crotalaria pallida]|uniref:Uncharacterized protein n=1 Tax=Crotalaria pallida TaxID=3830 RepID=A0AAN9I045_CROPI
MDLFVSRHIQASLCKLLVEDMPENIKGFDKDCIERLLCLITDIQNTKPDLGLRRILRVTRQLEHFIRMEFPKYEKNEEVMKEYTSREDFLFSIECILRFALKRERENQFIIEKVKSDIVKVCDEMERLRLSEDDTSRDHWSELERRRHELEETLENIKKIVEEEQQRQTFWFKEYPIMKRGFRKLKRMNAKATKENEEMEKAWSSILLRLQNMI